MPGKAGSAYTTCVRMCMCVESWILFGLEIVNIVGPGMNKLQIS